MKVVGMLILFVATVFVSGCQDVLVWADIPIIYPGQKQEGDCDTFLFPVRIGEQEYKFFADTGSSCTIIDDDLKHAGKLTGSVKPAYSFHGELLDVYKVKIPIKIGRLKVTGQVGCIDLDKLAEGCHVDGVLGQDIMKKFIVQMDFENGRFKLLRESSYRHKVRKNWGVEVPLIVDQYGFICVKVRLAKELDEVFILDSGIWGANLLREDVFDMLKDSEHLEEYVSGEYRAIVVPSAKIGESKVSELILASYPESKLITGRSMLGTQFLSRFKMVTIDLENKKLYLISK